VQRSALDEGRWQGHRTCLVGGSGCSMPDTSTLQAAVGQPMAAWVWRSHRPAPGAVPCGHRWAPDARGRTPFHPRSRLGAGGAARRCATDGRCYARSALCQTKCAADACRQRRATIPLAHNARRP
jgi:hypothetical protein